NPNHALPDDGFSVLKGILDRRRQTACEPRHFQHRKPVANTGPAGSDCANGILASANPIPDSTKHSTGNSILLVKDGPRRPGFYVRAAIFCWTILCLLSAAAFAQSAPPALTAEEETRLAKQFAPVLVFHPDEKYFPCSPLFALDAKSTASTATVLGTPESRTARYQALSIAEKAQLATVYYRAYRLNRTSYPAIVLEY